MSNSIQNFATSFVWEQRKLLLPLTLATAAAIEVGIFAKNVITKPEVIKKRFNEVKQWTVSSFTKKPGETPHEFRSRLIKNVLKVAGCAALLASAIALPFVFLSLPLAISLALISIYAISLTYKYAPKLAQKIGSLKTTLVHAFSTKPQGSEVTQKDVHLRILKNAAKVVLAVALAAAVGFATYHLIVIVIAIAALVKAGVFSVYQVLPSQTPLVVFLEYAAVGVLHLILAARSFYKGNKAQGFLHLTCGILSFLSPIYYIFFDPINIPRLHHSFIGLLLLLTPWRSVQFFGAMIAFDSLLYWISPLRGYLAPSTSSWDPDPVFHNFDFMNLVVPNLNLVVAALTGISFFQLASSAFFSDKDKESPSSICLDNETSPKNFPYQELQLDSPLPPESELC